MRTWIFAVLALWPAAPAAAAFGASAKGTTAASFLSLVPGARAAAMGEAYTAVADDASALYWNPAALARIQKRTATFSHAAHLDSSFYDYAAYGQSLGEWGGWGAGVQYFSAGSVAQTDITGSDAGSVTPNDLAISLGYAFPLKKAGPRLEGFSVGLAAKYIRSKLLATAQTAAVDIGVLTPGYLQNRLRLGLAVSNLGGKLKFEQEAAELPLAIKAGAAYKITERWLAALDLSLPRDDDAFVAAGTEYRFAIQDAWSLAGRFGFNSKTIGDISGVTGISFGLGFGLRGMDIDYALLPFGGLGQSHRVSVSCKF